MTTQVIKIHPRPETFKQNTEAALADKPLRKSLRTAMDMLMTKRKLVLSDEEELQMLRTLCEHVRQHALSKLPDLLVQLEDNLTRLGVRVHWAETVEEAQQIIYGIMETHNAKLMVKGKSMVSEEIELNHHWKAKACARWKAIWANLSCKWQAKTTHIVMPAITKPKSK